MFETIDIEDLEIVVTNIVDIEVSETAAATRDQPSEGGDIENFEISVKVKIDEVLDLRNYIEKETGELISKLKINGYIYKRFEGNLYEIFVNEDLREFEIDENGYIYLTVEAVDFA